MEAMVLSNEGIPFIGGRSAYAAKQNRLIVHVGSIQERFLRYASQPFAGANGKRKLARSGRNDGVRKAE
jgi:hypothetical protein